MTPSRNDTETTTDPVTCPVRGARSTRSRRQHYCSPTCHQTAWRARHTDPPTTSSTVVATRPRRPITVYACTECEQRYLGEKWYPDCQQPLPQDRHRWVIPTLRRASHEHRPHQPTHATIDRPSLSPGEPSLQQTRGDSVGFAGVGGVGLGVGVGHQDPWSWVGSAAAASVSSVMLSSGASAAQSLDRPPQQRLRVGHSRRRCACHREPEEGLVQSNGVASQRAAVRARVAIRHKTERRTRVWCMGD